MVDALDLLSQQRLEEALALKAGSGKLFDSPVLSSEVPLKRGAENEFIGFIGNPVMAIGNDRINATIEWTKLFLCPDLRNGRDEQGLAEHVRDFIDSPVASAVDYSTLESFLATYPLDGMTLVQHFGWGVDNDVLPPPAALQAHFTSNAIERDAAMVVMGYSKGRALSFVGRLGGTFTVIDAVTGHTTTLSKPLYDIPEQIEAAAAGETPTYRVLVFAETVREQSQEEEEEEEEKENPVHAPVQERAEPAVEPKKKKPRSDKGKEEEVEFMDIDEPEPASEQEDDEDEDDDEDPEEPVSGGGSLAAMLAAPPKRRRSHRKKK